MQPSDSWPPIHGNRRCLASKSPVFIRIKSVKSIAVGCRPVPTLIIEKMRLFDVCHLNLRVQSNHAVERARPGLLRAGDDELKFASCHYRLGLASTAKVLYSTSCSRAVMGPSPWMSMLDGSFAHCDCVGFPGIVRGTDGPGRTNLPNSFALHR